MIYLSSFKLYLVRNLKRIYPRVHPVPLVSIVGSSGVVNGLKMCSESQFTVKDSMRPNTTGLSVFVVVLIKHFCLSTTHYSLSLQVNPFVTKKHVLKIIKSVSEVRIFVLFTCTT